MKKTLTHAAALALVGWYLMLPTPHDSTLRYVPRLPLSQWTVIQSFDSADDCEEIHARGEAKTKKDLHKVKDPDTASPAGRLAFLYTQAECVATDDPRLREK